MTLEEFVLRVHAMACASTTPWMLIPASVALDRVNHAIRMVGPAGRQCPILFVGGALSTEPTYPTGQRLGLSWDTIAAIVQASDEEAGHDPVLRQALLEAVGLSQPQETAT